MYKRTPLERRVRLRGDVWSFWGHDYAGKRYTASTSVHGKENRPAAVEAARRIERNRSVPPPDPATYRAQTFTLGQALGLLDAHDKRVRAAPNTVKFHQGRGGHLVRLLGADRPCTNIDIVALTAYSDMRAAEEPDPHTIQKEHRVLRQALRLAKDAGCYAGDPSKLVVPGYDEASGLRGYYQPGKTWLSEIAWINALVNETSSNPDKHRVDRRDDILWIINSGVRRREPQLIRPENIDLDARTYKIELPPRASRRAPRKGGLKNTAAERELPLNDVTYEVARRRMRHVLPGHPLFTEWGSGNRDLKANWRRARAWLLTQCATARDRARLNALLPRALTFNDLRRTFCSLMKNAGVSFDDCAALLGHEDVAMVKLVYGQTQMATLQRAMDKLPAMTVPPQALPRRTQKLSRRQRRRMRAERVAAEACPPLAPTDTVFDTDRMRKSGSDGVD